MRKIIYPKPLRSGDKIAIVSPATTVKREYVEGAADHIRRRGYEPVVMPSALGPADGSFAASLGNRFADLRDSIDNREIKAIMCARGGYGCVHLLASQSLLISLAHTPKWMWGFSDVSVLHALWRMAFVASIHGPMAKHLSELPFDDPCSETLFRMLSGNPQMDYEVAPSPYNREGHATGELRGGNLAVLSGLAATPLDLLTAAPEEDVILFIEDVSEAIYTVERMLMRLFLSGTLSRIKGLIIGQFTEYRPDRNHDSMEGMIDALLRKCGINGIPVAFGFPVGHVDHNLPLVQGAQVELSVTSEKVILKTMT